MGKFITPLTQLELSEISINDAKVALLGKLAKTGLPIWPTIIVHPESLDHFLVHGGIGRKISSLLSQLNLEDPTSFIFIAKQIENEITRAEVSAELHTELDEFENDFRLALVEHFSPEKLSFRVGNAIDHLRIVQPFIVSKKAAKKGRIHTTGKKKDILTIFFDGNLYELSKSGGRVVYEQVVSGSERLDKRLLSELKEIGVNVQTAFFFPQELDFTLGNGKIFLLGTRELTPLE